MQRWVKFILTGFLATLAASRVQAADQPTVQQEFVAAMQRVRLNEPAPADSMALRAYPIYDYLVAARFRRDLAVKSDAKPDVAIDTFLRAHAGEPVARSLRNEWLLSLAQRGRWDWFLPRAVDVRDPQLICQRLEGQLETGDTAGLGAAALARWVLPQPPPHECDSVFAWLRAQGLVSAKLAEDRTRAALTADKPKLARQFAQDVPAARAAPLMQWAQLLEAPESGLTALVADTTLPVEAAALAAGFDRLSLQDSTLAVQLLPGLLARADMTPMLRSSLQRSAALGAAYDHDSDAVGLFEDMPRSAIDGDVYEWRVRAALWAGNYRRALQWIEQMPPALANEPRWSYWRARATAMTSGEDMAAPLFARIAGMRDFYGYLAADRLHRDYSLNAHSVSLDAAEQAALMAEPGLIRAHALFVCNMEGDASIEWAAALHGADPTIKVQAALLAAHWGWYLQSIATLAQAGAWDDVQLRYPRPYPDAIAKASQLTHLPADWILAVMRQESLFNQDAVSPANARGLMQMLPATAAAVARRWHLPRPDSLFDPSVALQLGAAYLRELLTRYDDQLGLSLAAYNAGPALVARWLPDRPMDADVWIENIPYNETRSYVQHVLEHIVAFAWVRDGTPPRLAWILPPVGATDTRPVVQAQLQRGRLGAPGGLR